MISLNYQQSPKSYHVLSKYLAATSQSPSICYPTSALEHLMGSIILQVSDVQLSTSDKSWRCEKHKKGGLIVNLKIKCRQHIIFILVRLISNYSSPPVKVISPLSNEVLIHYIQQNTTTALTTVKAFLSLTTDGLSQGNSLTDKWTTVCLMFSSKTIYHKCDNTQY